MIIPTISISLLCNLFVWTVFAVPIPYQLAGECEENTSHTPSDPSLLVCCHEYAEEGKFVKKCALCREISDSLLDCSEYEEVKKQANVGNDAGVLKEHSDKVQDKPNLGNNAGVDLGSLRENNNTSNTTSGSTKDKNNILQNVLNQGVNNDENIDKGSSASKPEKRQVTVQLDSITVSNDHDGFLKGKGEFINYAYVQGKQIIISMHVDSGQTIIFKPDRQVTVALDEVIPLSLFTIGRETDFCRSGAAIDNPPPEDLTELERILKDPNLDRLDRVQAVSAAQFEILKNNIESCGDRLGTINEFYYPPSYAGPEPNQISEYCHSLTSYTTQCSVPSSSNDFTLRYTINVPPT